ncbi:MAG: type II toxin-antitoxin system VapC family toxin [Saprospiraceae bacterium]|jgi:predicted nucleic acid-binding protein|nr:type II toxin-antitoxin system VapC family toxin [Saprospiraceae bacterium]
MKYLWDTNTAIYYLQQQFPASAEEFMDVIIAESTPCISAITEIELLCWKATTERDAEVLKKFIDSILIIELEQPIKLKTADIRKEHKIKLPDAIIAATATVYNLTLVTRNIKDFKNIPAMNLVNPWDK